MGDLRLFRIDNGVAAELQGAALALEKVPNDRPAFRSICSAYMPQAARATLTLTGETSITSYGWSTSTMNPDELRGATIRRSPSPHDGFQPWKGFRQSAILPSSVYR